MYLKIPHVIHLSIDLLISFMLGEFEPQPEIMEFGLIGLNSLAIHGAIGKSVAQATEIVMNPTKVGVAT